MKKLGFTIIGALAVVSAIVAVRTVTFNSQQMQPPPPPSSVQVDVERAARQLARAVTYQTISWQDPGQFDSEQFFGLHGFLRQQYPLMHQVGQVTTVNDYSLVIRIPGSTPELGPVVLAAHMDVVPAVAETLDQWEQPPFGGVITGGFIWGRGTLDDKVNMIAIAEAVEALLADNYRPVRPLVLAFGHDEEVGGQNGAREIVDTLAIGVAPQFVLDEGLSVTRGITPGFDRDVALVGIAERGFATLEFSAVGAQGHSSMPPDQTAIGIVADAIRKVEAAKFPARLQGPARTLFEWLGPEMPGAQRIIFANLWLFEPLARIVLTSKTSTNALIRTTAALTVFDAGTKENVLPPDARALVNFRLAPGDTVKGVIARVRRVVGDDRVQIKTLGDWTSDPSPLAPVDSADFQAIHRSIRQVFNDAVVAPSLVIGATDGRHYAQLTPRVYRFSPMVLRPEDLGRIHGVNERIAVNEFGDAVRFFHHLVVNTTGH